ncbi:MAG: Flp pilus assembly complex ATPase component TadA [Acidobacteria bacterium]|nr:Flp pilus assembly complex ATPase component TadA [Acidobacteriota bacterium]MBV9069815.1 Flp pilus assembly complex ATPase component TadA [Acidobacteriota bacterium]MBV9184277.1 Flp pilus assembly complex ATPase component TadA [Acidobacteriota bacterium]
MTATPLTAGRKSREVTVSYLGELLQNAGFVDEKQKVEIDNLDRQLRAQSRSARARGEEEASPFKGLMGMNLTDASGSGTRIDDFLLARLIAEDAALKFYKIDPLKLDVEMIESKISRPFARKHRMTPVAVRDGKLIVAVVNPFDTVALDTYHQMVKQEIEIVVASESDVMGVITEQYGFRASVTKAGRDLGRGAIDLSNLEQYVKLKSGNEIETSDAHIVNAVDFLLQHAYDSRASDIHIEPKREAAMIRFRIDGVLHEIQRVPKLVNLAITSRIKTMCRMDIAERRRPQDGRIKTEREGKEIELRVSTLPTAFGEKLVMRIFDPEVLIRDLGGLGFYEDELRTFADWIKRPHGIILVTGPTGSGKTVTLYTALKSLASPEINICTIEDPIEMVWDDFNQTSVQAKVGITFPAALRTILRQDPDIIMVGEIRDEETAQNAVQAALTGHLVFSTLHTNDSATSVTRLIDLGIQPFLISSTLVGTMAQRLMRRICEDCKRNRPLSVDEAGMLNLQAPAGKRIIVKEGAGCIRCRNTGYFGRTGIFEILPIDNAIRDLIDRSEDFLKIKEMAVKRGMRTLRQSALRKLAEGVTSFEEVVRVTGI